MTLGNSIISVKGTHNHVSVVSVPAAEEKETLPKPAALPIDYVYIKIEKT